MDMILYIIIVVFLCILTIRMLKKNIIVGGMALMQLLSIGVGPLVDDKFLFNNVFSILIILLFCWMLFMIIKPWEHISCYKSIYIYNDLGRLYKIYSRFMITMGVICSLAYIPVVILVNSLNIDINDFKYNDGMYDLFTSGALPIPHSLLSLATIFSRISVLLVPLHFYYLLQQNYKLAFLSLFASLCYILDGMTYFSRAVPVHFFLLYITLFYLIHKNLSKMILKWYKRLLGVLLIFFVFQFVETSNSRFEDSNEIELMSERDDGNLFKYISDPTIVSYVNYFSQGHYNAYDVVSKYNFETFEGKLSLATLNTFIRTFGIELYSVDKQRKNRERLWSGKYNYTFNSFLGYTIYDYGLILSIVFCVFYYKGVRNKVNRLKNGIISFSDFTILSLLIQIPLNAIFYSMVSFFLLPLLLILAVRFLVRIK